MNEFIVNVGQLRDLNSLIVYLIPQLQKLRNFIVHGSNPPIKFSFLDVGQTKENPYSFKTRVDALTGLLSITKKIRDSFGYRIPTILTWRREVFGFWDDVGFLSLANKFDLFSWDLDYLGGYETGETNPDSKIIFFEDIPHFSHNTSNEVVEEWKDIRRRTFKRKLLLEFSPVIESSHFKKKWSKELVDIFAITCSELIVNSLLHGQDLAFVGLQRTSEGFTITVCDSGIGFKESISKDYDWKEYSWLKKNNLNHLQAAILSTMINIDKVGLFDAINDVILCGGWVNISTYDSEIRIRKEFWNFLVSEYLDSIMNKKMPDFHSLHKFRKEGFIMKEELAKGYFQMYNGFIRGVRISFHVPFNT